MRIAGRRCRGYRATPPRAIRPALQGPGRPRSLCDHRRRPGDPGDGHAHRRGLPRRLRARAAHRTVIGALRIRARRDVQLPASRGGGRNRLLSRTTSLFTVSGSRPLALHRRTRTAIPAVAPPRLPASRRGGDWSRGCTDLARGNLGGVSPKMALCRVGDSSRSPPASSYTCAHGAMYRGRIFDLPPRRVPPAHRYRLFSPT